MGLSAPPKLRFIRKGGKAAKQVQSTISEENTLWQDCCRLEVPEALSSGQAQELGKAGTASDQENEIFAGVIWHL